jgi:cytidine deaminase
MDKNTLAKLAYEASLNSYSPYSNFPVGAALVTKDGRIFQGCNIENASYGLTNCAERTCLFTSYAAGVRKQDIEAFALYSKNESMVAPCGACRQVMVELLPVDCKIYIAYGKDFKVFETTLEELVPFAFSKEDLNND